MTLQRPPLLYGSGGITNREFCLAPSVEVPARRTRSSFRFSRPVPSVSCYDSSTWDRCVLLRLTLPNHRIRSHLQIRIQDYTLTYWLEVDCIMWGDLEMERIESASFCPLIVERIACCQCVQVFFLACKFSYCGVSNDVDDL